MQLVTFSGWLISYNFKARRFFTHYTSHFPLYKWRCQSPERWGHSDKIGRFKSKVSWLDSPECVPSPCCLNDSRFKGPKKRVHGRRGNKMKSRQPKQISHQVLAYPSLYHRKKDLFPPIRNVNKSSWGPHIYLRKWKISHQSCNKTRKLSRRVTHRWTYIHMQPEAMSLADISYFIQRIERAQHRGPRGGTDKKRCCSLLKGPTHENRHHHL